MINSNGIDGCSRVETGAEARQRVAAHIKPITDINMAQSDQDHSRLAPNGKGESTTNSINNKSSTLFILHPSVE